MSSSSSNHSIPGSPLPRKIQDLPTRHPTTNKKKDHLSSSFNRTQYYEPGCSSSSPGRHRELNRSQYLRQSLMTLQDEKYRCLESGRYRKALDLQSQIKRTRSVLNEAELKHLEFNHREEKKSIRKAYKQEISFFKSAWKNYFQQYRQQQKAKLDQFKRQQADEIQFIRQKLRRKCSSLRLPSREVLDLQRQEQYHLRQGNIAELMLIRKEKNKLIKQIRLERKELINRWTQIEGSQLERFQSKRYTNLVGRLDEQRKDQEKSFHSQHKRLKQKYKNILGQLKHEQIMTIHFVERRQTKC